MKSLSQKINSTWPSQDRNNRRLSVVHIVILMSAFMNAMLRLDADSDITLFRLTLPVATLFIAAINGKHFIQLALAMLFVSLCQIISFLLTPYPFNFYNITFYLNYLAMIVFGFYVYSLEKTFAPRSIDGLFSVYFYIMLMSLIAQFLTGLQYPNIPDAEGKLNGWHGNENDASLALTAFVFYSVRFGLVQKHLPGILVAVAIMAFNGSRASLLAMAAICCYMVFERFGKGAAGLLFALFAVLTLIYLQYTLADGQLLRDLIYFLSNLYEAFKQFLSLEVVSGVITSLEVRSAAATLAVIDFFNNPLFGIGSGNTIILILNNSVIFSEEIMSTHNMPLMMLAELGLLGLGAYVFLLVRASELERMRFIFWLLIFLFASLSQSGGFITNYYTLAALIVVISRPGPVRRERVAGSRLGIARAA